MCYDNVFIKEYYKELQNVELNIYTDLSNFHNVPMHLS